MESAVFAIKVAAKLTEKIRVLKKRLITSEKHMQNYVQAFCWSIRREMLP